jgi:hypothetical protein
LGSHILNPAKRAAFLKNAPADDRVRRPTAPGTQPVAAAPAAVFTPQLLDAVTLELTKILGPIAAHLVKQAARQAVNAEELYDRVANHVTDMRERTALLKRLRSL